MVDQIIRPANLPRRSSPVASEITPVDNGVEVAGATLKEIAEAGRPTATRTEAEAGVNSENAMTPLTTSQKIQYEIGRSLASNAQGALADSAVQPGDLATVATTGAYSDLIGAPPGLTDGDKKDIVVSNSGADWIVSRRFNTVSILFADTSMAYAAGTQTVTAGQIVEAQGFRYEVAASGASNHHITTAGGVKLYVRPNPSGELNVLAFGATGDGTTDDASAIQAAINAAGSNPSTTIRLPRPASSYKIGTGLTVSSPRTNIVADDNALITTTASIDMITCTAGNGLLRGLHLLRQGGSGKGLYLNGAPEWKIEHIRASGGHTYGVQTRNSHLTTLLKCGIYTNDVGFNDEGRSFGSEFIGCDIVGNNWGAYLRSDWSAYGGSFEQNVNNDVLVGITADHLGSWFGFFRAFGVHFEAQAGAAGATAPMIIVGPTGAPVSGKQGLVMHGCRVVGNSSARKAVENRQSQIMHIMGSEFFGYGAGATLITWDSASRGLRFSGNYWDSVGTFKSGNSGAFDCIDMDASPAPDGANNTSWIHNASGGVLRGVQNLFSTARSAVLFISSRRNSAGDALAIQTPGTDNATLFNRLRFTSGADVAVASFDSARVEVPGSFGNYFKVGGGYLWVDGSGRLRIKSSVPVSDTDGVVVGTQT